MIVRTKKGTEQPHWLVLKVGKTYADIRTAAKWIESNGRVQVTNHKFFDTQEELDDLPNMCDIGIMFSDGTHVELPKFVFIEIFEIMPEGDLTDALYGN